MCEDCGGKEFKVYNEEKNLFCCAECGQFKTMEGEESGIVQCNGCGYISKEHKDGDACSSCDGGKMRGIFVLSLKDKFEEVAIPLIAFIKENCHPHVTAIIDSNHAELLEGIAVLKAT